MDYVIKCRKAELRETVENVMNNPDKYKSVMDNGKNYIVIREMYVRI